MELILKPCPFCGGKGRVRKLKNGYRIVCKECGASSHYVFTQPWHDNKYVAQCQAAKAWNSRHVPINRPLTIAELRAMGGEPVFDFMGDEWFVIGETNEEDIVMTDESCFGTDEASPNTAVGRFFRCKLEKLSC